MVRTSERKGWKYLLELAESDSRDDRQVALIRAYSWVEHALGASGLHRRKEPVASLLLKAHREGLLPATLSIDTMRKAVNTRHLAAHMDTVPGPTECHEAVEALCDTWHSLKRSYVTASNAVEAARMIMSVVGVLSISLYGSLARNSPQPNDIDLLVFDDGRYSHSVNRSDLAYPDRVRLTRTSLRLLGLHQSPLEHVVNCRWIDIMLINGTLFGADGGHTRMVAKCQPDPYFFLNIAPDVRDYSMNGNCFVDTRVELFLKLREVIQTLCEMGLPILMGKESRL